MRDLLNAMSMRAALQSATRVARLHGIVESYDPNTYSVKVALQPSGTMTGWIPILTGAIGQGYGVAYGPQIGDQAVVDFADGDVESAQVTGFIFSDSDRPPPVPSGELWTVQKTGSFLKMHNDGTIEIVAAAGMKYTATQHHFVGPVLMDNTITGLQGIAISGDNGTGNASTVTGNFNTVGAITNNGHDIGSGHRHVNSGGSGLGGAPQ